MYEGVKSEEHLYSLMNKEPPWDFFEYSEVTDQLFHLNGHSNLLVKYKPQSVEDLAMILAIMRPAKAYLQQHNWESIKKNVWIKVEGDENYQFKRAHGIAYAIAIIVNLNLLIEKLSKD
jgi:DNA polymerase III alpha subunit